MSAASFRTGGADAANDVAQEPVLLTVDEAAAMLRTTPKAVYTMVERGQVGGVTRIGRRVLFHRADLLRWLSERRAASPERTRR